MYPYKYLMMTLPKFYQNIKHLTKMKITVMPKKKKIACNLMPKSTIKLCKHKAGETELRKIELGFTSLFRNSLKRGRKTLLLIPQFFPDSEAQIL